MPKYIVYIFNVTMFRTYINIQWLLGKAYFTYKSEYIYKVQWSIQSLKPVIIMKQPN